MTLAAIVAMTPDRVIGADNQIPWYLPSDLRYFKRTTLGHPVIMGRKCFRSIGRPLPKRTNIVLSRDPHFIATGIVAARSKSEALAEARATGADTSFVIGGAEIYSLFWEETELLYLTQVNADVAGDVYFPEVDPQTWSLESSEAHSADAKNPFDFEFRVLRRR